MIALGPLNHNQLEFFGLAEYITRYKQKVKSPNQTKPQKQISKPSQMIDLGPLNHNQLEFFILAAYITRYKQDHKIAKPNQTEFFFFQTITNDTP